MSRIFLSSIVLMLLVCSARADDVLVPKGAIWKYRDGGVDLGTIWSSPAFGDLGWSSGPAELGYGDGDEATVVSFGPSAGNKYVTTYFRHTFNVVNPAAYVALKLELRRDDGAVVFLNGVEITRSNMTTNSIDYQTFAASTIGGHEEDQFYPYWFDPGLLVAGSNLLAVEIHQRTASSSDISFDCEFIGIDDPGLIRGPYLQLGTPDSVVVRWRTDGPTDSRVEWGSAPGNLTQSMADATLETDHSMTLSGLSPDTEYFYSVGTQTSMLAGDDADHYFRTAPAPGTPKSSRIWIVGDSGTGNDDAAAVRDAYLTHAGGARPDLWLMLGDNAYALGNDEEYQVAVFDTYPTILRNSVVWPTRGNHETNESAYYGIFDMPTLGEAGGVSSGTEAYYSFDYANVHFICLDSQGSDRSVGGAMWTWLQSDLANTDQDWIVAFWHHPPYSKGSHDSDTEGQLIDMRQNFLDLLESGGVDLVFCGHSHSYERTFLLDGHYGFSGSLTEAMKLDGGDGRVDGDGAYEKATIPNAGCVYTVAGSSGKTSSAALGHPAMFFEKVVLGSVILDVDDEQIDVTFLNDAGVVEDYYTLKTVTDEGLVGDKTTISLSLGGTQNLALDAGLVNANRTYALLGSLSGTEPGFLVWPVTLPLNYDNYMLITLTNANTPFFQNSFSTLDANGTASVAISFPPGLPASAVGLTLHHAYVVVTASDIGLFASNPFPLVLQP